MNPEVKNAEPLPNYRLKLKFDVSPYLDKGIFKDLKDAAYFKQVRVSFAAVEWPNEQDFSKDTLYLLGTNPDD